MNCLKIQADLKNKIFLIALISLLILPIILFYNALGAQNNSKVLFDESGSDGKLYTIYNIGPGGSSSFAALLEANGYSVSKLTDVPITVEKLEEYDVLILMGPARNYDDHEITAIKEFVNDGGGLFILTDPWRTQDGDNNYSFNKIARSFGVNFVFNYGDTMHNIPLSSVIKTNNIIKHPVTANITEMSYIAGTYHNPGSAEVTVVSDADSWSDHGYITAEGSSQNNEIKEPGKAQGSLPLIYTTDYGKGKIVFMGSVQTLMNSLIYRSNGWKIGLNSVNWLSNHPVASNYKTASLISLNIGYLFYKVIAVIPLTLLFIYGLIYVNEKKDRSDPLTFKPIKNWKFISLIVINAFFALLASILFFPVNFSLFDISNIYYDPHFGYMLITTGVFSIILAASLLYNLILNQRINKKCTYYYLLLILFFEALILLIGDIFPVPMILFVIGGFILLTPLLVNLWIIKGYGPVIVIEGKEFNRLENVSFKTLPYELQDSYANPVYVGEGGFGRVFKAKNLNGKEVAIKILKSFDKRARKTFISEVSNWSHLNHPNIIKLNDFKILPIPYVEMECCKDRLEHGKKPLEQAIAVVYDVAKGLQYAHNQNIIHGDIKTSNIIVGDGVYKISDWGLSKLKISESITLSGATPRYAAPEQISHQFGKSDERTDIYQLGNVFYELVTGQLPFKGDMPEIYGSILNVKPVLPSKLEPEAADIENIIMKCLNKDKDDRYSSMGELLEELGRYYNPEDKML